MSRDPIFVAKFEDGHETCTAVLCPPSNLDLALGVMLARRARNSLLIAALKLIKDKENPSDEDTETAQRLCETLQQSPRIIAARFEHNGTVLREYGADEICHCPQRPLRPLPPTPPPMPPPPTGSACFMCGGTAGYFEHVTYRGAPKGGVLVHRDCVDAFFRHLDRHPA
jgi:hypothetical protein